MGAEGFINYVYKYMAASTHKIGEILKCIGNEKTHRSHKSQVSLLYSNRNYME